MAGNTSVSPGDHFENFNNSCIKVHIHIDYPAPGMERMPTRIYPRVMPWKSRMNGKAICRAAALWDNRHFIP